MALKRTTTTKSPDLERESKGKDDKHSTKGYDATQESKQKRSALSSTVKGS